MRAGQSSTESTGIVVTDEDLKVEKVLGPGGVRVMEGDELDEDDDPSPEGSIG